MKLLNTQVNETWNQNTKSQKLFYKLWLQTQFRFSSYNLWKSKTQSVQRLLRSESFRRTDRHLYRFYNILVNILSNTWLFSLQEKCTKCPEINRYAKKSRNSRLIKNSSQRFFFIASYYKQLPADIKMYNYKIKNNFLALRCRRHK